ncbi:MAG: hypothetical protein U0Z70_14265 [Thermomicrobiales bacterium]|nr:hypothetical protein [Chloroflexia bacterium]
MRAPHRRPHALLPGAWLWLLALALATGGILLGIRSDDYHLVNRSAAVLLLAIALVCVREILG